MNKNAAIHLYILPNSNIYYYKFPKHMKKKKNTHTHKG